jgi:hypothetical protein
MKFGKYVGHDVEKKIRKKVKFFTTDENTKNRPYVDTSIGKTDKGFYDVVARQDKPITETSVGFGLSKMQLKRVFDYVKSWLIRYDIKYESLNPYLTVARVEGNYKRDRLIKALKKVRENQVFEPEGVFILREGDTDFIILDCIFNRNFADKLNESIMHFKLAKKEDSCYIKLFSLKAESFPLDLFDQMVYSLPILPNVTVGSVGLLVRRK